MPEKELSAIEILDEINRNLSPEKATRAMTLVPKLREAVMELERAEGIRGEAFWKLEMELRERLGDVRICDKHKIAIMWSDGVGGICGDCEQERIEKEKIDVQNADNYFPLECPAWHWEEKKVSK